MENKLLEINLNETTEYDFDDFTQNLEYELFEHKIEFPVALEAVASNCRGQTGYAEAKNQSDLISKISSFEPSYAELLYQYQQADETAGGYMSEPIGEAIKELENLTDTQEIKTVSSIRTDLIYCPVKNSSCILSDCVAYTTN